MEETDLMINPNLFGHGCVLAALGRGFEPKLFLARSIFPPAAVLGFGKMGLPAELRNKSAEKLGEEAVAAFFDAKYLALEISKSGVNAVQHKAAVEFLSRYREEILRLSQFAGVEQVNLRCVAAPGEPFESHLPDALIELGAACGLTMLM